MATNFVQPGDTITVAAPYDRSSGEGVLVGSIFGVALEDADYDASESLLISRVGVWSLTKVGSQAWTVGAQIWWDNSNKYCTTTADGNTFIGVCVEAVADGAGDTTGKVALMPSGRANVAALAGTLTGTVDGTLADVAAVSTAGGNTYADSAINTAITSINLQLKELQTKLNAVIAAL